MRLPTGSVLLALIVLYVATTQVSPAQQPALGSGDSKGAVAPSPEVQIVPTTMPPGTTNAVHDDKTWTEQGFDLKTMVAELYGMDASRVRFTDPNTGSQRYDVTLVLPKPESEEAMDRRIQEALKKRFHLAISMESRLVDVYVVTAPHGLGEGLKRDNAPGGSIESHAMIGETITGSGRPTEEEIRRFLAAKQASTGVSLSEISVSSGTIADFCRTLELGLDRPVLDESNLTGHYDFQVNGFQNKDELFTLMRTKLGLVVKPDRRDVRFLVVGTVVGAATSASGAKV